MTRFLELNITFLIIFNKIKYPTTMHKRPNKVWLSTKLFCITSGILSRQKNWFGKSKYLESFLMEQPPYKLKWNHIANITKIKQKLTKCEANKVVLRNLKINKN